MEYEKKIIIQMIKKYNIAVFKWVKWEDQLLVKEKSVNNKASKCYFWDEDSLKIR